MNHPQPDNAPLRFSLRKVLIALTAVAVATAALTPVIRSLEPSVQRHFGMLVLLVLLGGCTGLAARRLLYRCFFGFATSKHNEEVLLAIQADVSRYPRSLVLVNALALLTLLLASAYQAVFLKPGLMAAQAFLYFIFSHNLAVAVVAQHRPLPMWIAKFTDHGFYGHWTRFTPWDELRISRWQPQIGQLVLAYRNRIDTIGIPTEDREAVDAILRRYRPDDFASTLDGGADDIRQVQ